MKVMDGWIGKCMGGDVNEETAGGWVEQINAAHQTTQRNQENSSLYCHFYIV